MIEKSEIRIILITENTDGSEKESLITLGYNVVATATDGTNGAALIRKYRPDVVLCDTFLPGSDALSVLEEAREKAWNGIFIAMSYCQNDMLAAKLMENGVDYFIVRPFSFSYLNRRILTLMEERRRSRTLSAFRVAPQINDRFDLENCVADLMRQIGVPAHILGYKYIRRSIMLALENADILSSITKELYPTVAHDFETTPSRVERAIRHAIEVAWARGDIDVLNTLFGYTVKTSKGKPTNGEFISMLADRLRLDLKLG